MASRLPTGIDVLDRKIDGGIPAGSVVAYQAPPASQAELLLYELTAARESTYITTRRSKTAVADALAATAGPTGDPTIVDVTSGEPLDEARRQVRTLPESANLIIDPVDELESREGERYGSFLNDLQNHVTNTGSVAVLYCLNGHSPPEHRDVTTHLADVVFDLQVEVDGGDMLTRLAVPKFRGGAALTETIKLELADTVAIDTSRDIA